MLKWFLAAAVVSAAIVVSCSNDNPVVHGCNGGPPGTLIQVAGIVVEVRDPFGRGQAIGTTATVRRSDGFTPYTEASDTLRIESAFDLAGSFSVMLTRPYYRDTTITKISVTPNGCIVNTTTLPVVMQLVPGAPPLRALTLVGAAFLDHAGAQVQLLAHFDADPGTSQAVTWEVDNAALASIDANGLLTAKCTTAGGTVKVMARSVANTSIWNTVNIGVAPASSCP